MLKWLIRNRLAAFEREFGYDVSYMRELLAIDTRAFFKFAKISGMSKYRRDVPKDLYYAASITTTLAEDCGPCVQLNVTMALKDGVEPRLIAAILEGNDATMTDEARLGAELARAVLAHAPEADVAREEIERRWGPRAVVSAAFAITGARFYPTLKYAMGFGKACQRVIVDGKTIIPGLKVEASTSRRPPASTSERSPS